MTGQQPDRRPLRPAAASPLTLAEAFAGVPGVVLPQMVTTICGMSLDSRTVGPGELYVALPGTRAHGADFASMAASRGAVAVLTDAAGAERASGTGLPVVVAERPREAMALAARTVFGRPDDRLQLFGITGTNGKTTTAFLVEAGLAAAGRHPGTVGTIGFRLDQAPLPGDRTTVTTPESPDLQALLAYMAERGADSVVMEVSSHALALDRVAALHFAAVAFTNLGRDHLDFHKTIEDYFEAKARLFEPGRSEVAVITIDDEHGRELAGRITTAGSPRLVTTGFAADADYRILSWAPQGAGAALGVRTPTGELSFELALPGEYNVRNAVTALALLAEAGYDPGAVVPGLSRAQVPGRMQQVDLGPGAPLVYVDFAHTPQAIAAALSAVPSGHVVVSVLGAGGDRDPDKRGPMGLAAVAGSDIVVVTDDNPRSEDPAVIRAAVAAGARAAATGERAGVHVVEQGGRAEAIARALELAGPHGVVALLGKGHEQGQTVGDQVLPFDDVDQVRRAWRARAAAGGGAS